MLLNPWKTLGICLREVTQKAKQRHRKSTLLRRHFMECLEQRVLPAITITVDYSRDSSNFFDPASGRREILEAAILEVSQNLNDTLLEIVPHKDNPIDTWTAQFTNPSTGLDEEIPDLIVGENEIMVFVGARQLGSSTLGIGGFGGASIISGTSNWIDRVIGRGSAGAVGSGSSVTDFSPWGGSLAFDSDTNWFFGLTTTGLTAANSDFYSVAMHEFAHLAGFGTAESWDNLVSGSEFTGPASIAEYDLAGNPPLSGDLGHWQNDTTDDGRETAMDPSILNGTRKTLTPLDFAALDDIGWMVTTGAGGGGGGGGFSGHIELADGTSHTIVFEDDGDTMNGISQYTLDGGSPVSFPTGATQITLSGGDQADSIIFTGLDPAFTSTFIVNSDSGDDVVNYDHTVAGLLAFTGGTGSDRLELIGSTTQSMAYTFSGATSGNVIVTDSGTETFTYSDTEEVLDTVTTGTRSFDFAPGADTVSLLDDTIAGNGRSEMTSTASSPSVTFTTPTTSVVLNTGSDNDAVTIGLLDSTYASGVSVNAGDGNDLVTAASSNVGPTIDGNLGNDSITGSGLPDLIFGNGGNDSVVGGGGGDNLFGGSGSDTLLGGDGDDNLSGQSGNADALSGGLGNDTFNGGTGNDLLFESGDANFTLTNTSLVGMGTDVLVSLEAASLVGGGSANTLNASAVTFPVTMLGGGGNDTLMGGTNNDFLSGNGGNDSISSGTGNDIVFGNDGNDFVNGGGGTDSIDGGTGNDIAMGGDDNDTLRGGDGIDQLSGESGADSLLGGIGADALFGGDGNDVVDGENDNDSSISGGLGDDTLRGGTGTDRLFETADVNFTLTTTGLTGVGTDTHSGFESAQLTGGASANAINTSVFAGSVTVFGGAGNDTITTGAAADFVVGDDGNDSVLSGVGNDMLLGGSGADTLNGGDGNDTIQGQGGSLDSLLGGLGNDVIDGGTGNDKLFGNDGNDTLIGGDGADIMLGGNNDDSLLGGNDIDTLFGEAGNDILNGGAGNDSLDGGIGNDGLSGFTGNDIINGGTGTDTLFGGDGNDTLNGGDDSDTCIGLAGADSVSGNDGVDKLVGGSGTGTADVGDVVTGDPSEIDENFSISPLPDWVNRI